MTGYSSYMPGRITNQTCFVNELLFVGQTPSPSSGLLPSPSTALFHGETNQKSVGASHGPTRAENNLKEPTASPNIFSLDPALKDDIAWMYETNLFEFNDNRNVATTKDGSINFSPDTNSLASNNNVLLSVNNSQSEAKVRRPLAKTQKPLTNSNSQPEATVHRPMANNNPMMMISSVGGNGYPKKVAAPTTITNSNRVSNTELSKAATAAAQFPQIVYSSTEFNHHSFITNKDTKFMPLDRDIDLENEDLWVDISDDDSSEANITESGNPMHAPNMHAQPANETTSSRNRWSPLEQQAEICFHPPSPAATVGGENTTMMDKAAVKNSFVKPAAVKQVGKKSSISSLKDLFKRNKSEEMLANLQSEPGSLITKKKESKLLAQKITNNSESTKVEDKRGTFVLIHAYDHSSKGAALPPPIMGRPAIVEQPTGGTISSEKMINKPMANQMTNQNQITNKITNQTTNQTTNQKPICEPKPVAVKYNNRILQKHTNPTGLKYNINSTPIMNNYKSRTEDLCRSSSSLVSKEPNALIIEVPHSISELNSIMSLNHMPLAKTQLQPNVQKSALLIMNTKNPEKSNITSPLFYFVSPFEKSPNTLTDTSSYLESDHAFSTPRQAPTTNATTPETCPHIPENMNHTAIEMNITPINSQVAIDMDDNDFLLSPTSTTGSDIQNIKKQYLSEPSSPGSNRFSMNSNRLSLTKKSSFPFQSSVKIQQNPFKRKSLDTWYDRGSYISLNDSKSYFENAIQSQYPANNIDPGKVKVNDKNTVTIKVVKNASSSTGPAFTSSSGINSTSANAPYSLPTIMDVDEELEEDIVKGAKTTLLPEEDLDMIERTLSRDYRAKKQREKLLELQQFGQEPKSTEKTSLKDKRMTCSLLYNSFYNDTNNAARHYLYGNQSGRHSYVKKDPYDCANTVMSSVNTTPLKKASVVSATQLRHFSKTIGADVAANRSRKLAMGLDNDVTVPRTSSTYFDLRNVEKMAPRKSLMQYVTCKTY